jgi:maltose/moltooligosaccharide transporter
LAIAFAGVLLLLAALATLRIKEVHSDITAIPAGGGH